MRIWKISFPARNKRQLLLALGIPALAAALCLSLCIGSSGLSLGELFHALLRDGSSTRAEAVLWYARLPRTLAAALAGAGLAIAGGILQGALSNSLASPNIIGVNAGAGLGVTVCCVLGLSSGWVISTAAFLGSCAAIFLITALASRIGASRTTVILAGVALNSILNAASESLAVLSRDAAISQADFRMGGFSGIVYPRLLPGAALLVLGFLAVGFFTSDLDLLLLGDETAGSLGLPVKRTRNLLLVLASLLAGASVSFAGLLGFVGLVVPHFVRALTGSEARWLLPLSGIYGALLVTVCDLFARTLFAPFELPVGILLAAIGGPFFLFLLVSKKGGHRNG